MGCMAYRSRDRGRGSSGQAVYPSRCNAGGPIIPIPVQSGAKRFRDAPIPVGIGAKRFRDAPFPVGIGGTGCQEIPSTTTVSQAPGLHAAHSK